MRDEKHTGTRSLFQLNKTFDDAQSLGRVISDRHKQPTKKSLSIIQVVSNLIILKLFHYCYHCQNKLVILVLISPNIT